jgi:hypothetical protein
MKDAGMTLDRLIELQRAQPFRPYRIHLADGKTLDVMLEVGSIVRGDSLLASKLEDSPDATSVPTRPAEST